MVARSKVVQGAAMKDQRRAFFQLPMLSTGFLKLFLCLSAAQHLRAWARTSGDGGRLRLFKHRNLQQRAGVSDTNPVGTAASAASGTSDDGSTSDGASNAAGQTTASAGTPGASQLSSEPQMRPAETAAPDCDEPDVPLRPGEVRCKRQPIVASQANPDPEEFSWGFSYLSYIILFLVSVCFFCYVRKYGCPCCCVRWCKDYAKNRAKRRAKAQEKAKRKKKEAGVLEEKGKSKSVEEDSSDAGEKEVKKRKEVEKPKQVPSSGKTLLEDDQDQRSNGSGSPRRSKNGWWAWVKARKAWIGRTGGDENKSRDKKEKDKNLEAKISEVRVDIDTPKKKEKDVESRHSSGGSSSGGKKRSPPLPKKGGNKNGAKKHRHESSEGSECFSSKRKSPPQEQPADVGKKRQKKQKKEVDSDSSSDHRPGTKIRSQDKTKKRRSRHSKGGKKREQARTKSNDDDRSDTSGPRDDTPSSRGSHSRTSSCGSQQEQKRRTRKGSKEKGSRSRSAAHKKRREPVHRRRDEESGCSLSSLESRRQMVDRRRDRRLFRSKSRHGSWDRNRSGEEKTARSDRERTRNRKQRKRNRRSRSFTNFSSSSESSIEKYESRRMKTSQEDSRGRRLRPGGETKHRRAARGDVDDDVMTNGFSDADDGFGSASVEPGIQHRHSHAGENRRPEKITREGNHHPVPVCHHKQAVVPATACSDDIQQQQQQQEETQSASAESSFSENAVQQKTPISWQKSSRTKAAPRRADSVGEDVSVTCSRDDATLVEVGDHFTPARSHAPSQPTRKQNHSTGSDPVERSARGDTSVRSAVPERKKIRRAEQITKKPVSGPEHTRPPANVAPAGAVTAARSFTRKEAPAPVTLQKGRAKTGDAGDGHAALRSTKEALSSAPSFRQEKDEPEVEVLVPEAKVKVKPRSQAGKKEGPHSTAPLNRARQAATARARPTTTDNPSVGGNSPTHKEISPDPAIKKKKVAPTAGAQVVAKRQDKSKELSRTNSKKRVDAKAATTRAESETRTPDKHA
ncbi:unnamed protein product [Amoebophrya sp. A120]|nr:unnamed protein product [Amoebophrya sp. A120]|eukprot:GSA120T00001530001.1